MNTEQFDEILHIDDPNFGEKFVSALGLEAGDSINIRTPQFERTDGLEVKPAPNKLEAWKDLSKLPVSVLKTLGLQEWGEWNLWLFPGEWFKSIPNGLEVMCINGKISKWDAATHDNDTRYGALAYGICLKA